MNNNQTYVNNLSPYRQQTTAHATRNLLLAIPILTALFGLLLALPTFALGKTAVSHPPQTQPLDFVSAQITPTNTSTATPTPTIIPTSTPLPPLSFTAIEPGRMSNETGGTLTVYGYNFTAGTVIRIVGVGVIPSTYVNNEVVTGIVPPGIPPGFYNIQVGLGNNDGSYVVRDGIFEVYGPTPTPAPTETPIPTATAVYIFGQPQLAIQSATTNPAVPEAGQPFELTMSVTNQGNWTAIDIEVELLSTDIAVPAAGSNVRILPRVGVGETVTTTVPLVLSQSVPDGPQNLNFNIDYFDINGKPYNTQQSIGLAVSEVTATPTPGPEQPRLVLTTYEVDPTGKLEPGAIFDLVLNVTNVGNAETENVIVTLGGAAGEQLQPFALLNAGNIRYIDKIAAGETVEVRQTLLVAGTAVSGVYNLPIDLAYDDSDGTPLTISQVINLLVEKPPQLQVNFYRPVELGLVDEPLDLPVEVVNIGRSLINVSTLAITSPDMDIQNNTLYVGPLDGGTSGSLDALAIPNTGGQIELLVSVNYLDDFSQPQIYETTLTVQIEEPDVPEALEIGADGTPVTPESSDEDNGEETFIDLLWRFVKGMLGLGS
ncbi:MAG: hypothetical protein GY943_07940 [Chloroflexi bacterium]|nr:hypothetical protein [Chloroflexota bacterium]